MPFDATPEIPPRAPFSPEQQILLKAADLLRTHGHLKGKMGHPAIGFCTLGAIMAAAAILRIQEVDRAVDRVMRVIGRAIAGWNDAPERTLEQVLAALEKAAALRPLPKAAHPFNEAAFTVAMQIMQINLQLATDLISGPVALTTEGAILAMASP